MNFTAKLCVGSFCVCPPGHIFQCDLLSHTLARLQLTLSNESRPNVYATVPVDYRDPGLRHALVNGYDSRNFEPIQRNVLIAFGHYPIDDQVRRVFEQRQSYTFRNINNTLFRLDVQMVCHVNLQSGDGHVDQIQKPPARQLRRLVDGA